MAGPVKPPVPPTPSAAEWRSAMGYFPTGVTVVTTWGDGAPLGSTVSSFCSVSLDPPLLLVCLDFSNPILEPLETSRVFGVNILDADGQGLARRFAGEPWTERFGELPFHAEPGGAPHLSAAPVFIDCVLVQAHDAGDHRVIIGLGGRIARGEEPPTPLLYHRGRFPGLGDAP